MITGDRTEAVDVTLDALGHETDGIVDGSGRHADSLTDVGGAVTVEQPGEYAVKAFAGTIESDGITADQVATVDTITVPE